jgi:broad specificity phosphatase PhoE
MEGQGLGVGGHARWRQGEEAELSFFLLLLALAALPVQASEALWTLLKGGGQVIFIRHAITMPGVGDPPGFKLEDCSTQRNLTDEGRGHATRIGEAFRKRAIPVERIVTSPWCRCIETAKLAFGKHDEVSTALSNLFGRQENRDQQVAQLKTFVPKKGNLVMVSHGSTIAALTGITPGTGEMVVVTPQDNGRFAVAGRLGVN